MTRLIVSQKSGQLGNQLFLFAHLIAFAEEFGWRIQFPSFYEYRASFVGPSLGFVSSYPTQIDTSNNLIFSEERSSLDELVYHVSKLIGLANRRFKFFSSGFAGSISCAGVAPAHSIDLANEQCVNEVYRKGTTFLYGYVFRNYALFAKHESSIRRYLDFKHRPHVDSFVKEIRQKYRTVIAIHMRLGDYRYYQNGQYYFEPELYAECANAIANRNGHSDTAFVIFSNENINLRSFGGLNVYKGPGEVIDDQYAMSLVDGILAPPSTFSRWAAFIGRVPLGYLTREKMPIDLAKFKVPKQ